MEIQGKIIHVLPLQSGVGKSSSKEWKKQEFVIEILEGQYARKICFSMWGDLIDRVQLQEGENVTVQVDVESREYQGRWYTEVKAWRVDRMASNAVPPQIQNAPTVQSPATMQAPSGDDLPF